MVTNMKELRKIVLIDEDKCTGCGLCIPNCAEGAMQIVNGKAKLITDKLCDGLGACLGSCPEDAISIIERVADPFDEVAVERHLGGQSSCPGGPGHGPLGKGQQHPPFGGCPGSRSMSFDDEPGTVSKATVAAGDVEVSIMPQLRQWPVQLRLVSESAPYFAGADLLVAADCVPFAYANFHPDLLKGKAVVIGCPKLDDNQFNQDKLTKIIANNNLKSITVAIMEVPCCSGLLMAVEEAVRRAGSKLPVNRVIIGVRGDKLPL